MSLPSRDGTSSRSSRLPAISSFGLWVEQLIAESTGKEGLGIVPVAGEPLASPNHYGDDRLFVYLRLDGDDNDETDDAIEAIESSGQPVVRLDLRDKYDLGAEFFRWELATAVAGAILSINPFDQPNVQAAKDMTESVLSQFQSSGKLPDMEDSVSLGKLLATARQGDYLAIMAYVQQTPGVNQALDALRLKVTERHGIATTMGYGLVSCTLPANSTKAVLGPDCFCSSQWNMPETWRSLMLPTPLACWPTVRPWRPASIACFRTPGRPGRPGLEPRCRHPQNGRRAGVIEQIKELLSKSQLRLGFGP